MDIGNILKKSWSTMNENKGFYFTYLGLIASITLIFILAIGFTTPEQLLENDTLTSFQWLLVSVFMFLCTAIGLIFTLGTIRVLDGEKLKAGDAINLIKPASKKFFPYLGVSIVYGLIILVGCLLLIIPGIIWSYVFMLAPYLVVCRNYSISDAISKSKIMTYGHKVDMFVAFLIIGLIQVPFKMILESAIKSNSVIAIIVSLLIFIPFSVYQGIYQVTVLHEVEKSNLNKESCEEINNL